VKTRPCSDASTAPYAIVSAMTGRKQAGFTLLETLVTLVVLSFLMTGLVQGLRLGVTVSQRQAHKQALAGEIDVSDRTLRTLIARMDPGGFGARPATFSGSSHTFLFTTTLPAAAAGLATPEMDVTLRVNEEHQMQLLWLPHYRNRIGPAPPTEHATLMHGVDHLEIAYWQEPKSGWQPDWTERVLPRLIRIRIIPVRDGGPQGPDIVIAPMRDRWRQ